MIFDEAGKVLQPILKSKNISESSFQFINTTLECFQNILGILDHDVKRPAINKIIKVIDTINIAISTINIYKNLVNKDFIYHKDKYGTSKLKIDDLMCDVLKTQMHRDINPTFTEAIVNTVKRLNCMVAVAKYYISKDSESKELLLKIAIGNNKEVFVDRIDKLRLLNNSDLNNLMEDLIINLDKIREAIKNLEGLQLYKSKEKII